MKAVLRSGMQGQQQQPGFVYTLADPEAEASSLWAFAGLAGLGDGLQSSAGPALAVQQLISKSGEGNGVAGPGREGFSAPNPKGLMQGHMGW